MTPEFRDYMAQKKWFVRLSEMYTSVRMDNNYLCNSIWPTYDPFTEGTILCGLQNAETCEGEIPSLSLH